MKEEKRFRRIMAAAVAAGTAFGISGCSANINGCVYGPAPVPDNSVSQVTESSVEENTQVTSLSENSDAGDLSSSAVSNANGENSMDSTTQPDTSVSDVSTAGDDISSSSSLTDFTGSTSMEVIEDDIILAEQSNGDIEIVPDASKAQSDDEDEIDDVWENSGDKFSFSPEDNLIPCVYGPPADLG